jgi:hypothetical protein
VTLHRPCAAPPPPPLSGVLTLQTRESRAYLLEDLPAPHPAADHPWRTGRAWQAVMEEQPAKLAGADRDKAGVGSEDILATS